MKHFFPPSMWRAGILLWLALCASAAQAHKASDAYLQLTLPSAAQASAAPRLETRWDIALRDLERELQLDRDDDGRLSWGEVHTRWDDIQGLALRSLSLATESGPCRAQALGEPQLETRSDGRYAVLRHAWTCPGTLAGLQVRYRLFADSDPTHRGIAVVQPLDATADTPPAQALVLPPDGTPVALALPGHPGDAGHGQAPAAVFAGFVKEGMHHILIGTDHVLFLLALLLPAVLVRHKPGKAGGPASWQPAPALGPVLRDVLRVVTAFTVAHSVTLGLAVFGVVSPPARWIESIIAASVVLAALNNLAPVVGRDRWKLGLVFGLIHGFGFANALQESGLRDGGLAAPLFGFNLGVELGQLAIVAVFLLLAWPLHGRAVYRGLVLRAGSAGVALVATLWLLERALDLDLTRLGA